MNQDCQEKNGYTRHFLCLVWQVVAGEQFTNKYGGYTPGVSRKTSETPELLVGRRIRELRGTRTLDDVNTKAGIGTSKLSKLERGKAQNPRLHTYVAVARGLKVPLEYLFTEVHAEAAHAEAGARDPHAIHPALQSLVDRFAVQPAPGSWQSDVLDALAALTRALQRPGDTGTTAERPAKTGR